MHFKSFKGFTLGKKEGPGRGPARKVPAAGQTSVMEDKINGQTADPDDLAQKIQELAASPGVEIDARPHGPVGELSIVPEELAGDDIAEIIPPVPVVESQEEVKLVEMKVNQEPVPAPAPAAEPTVDIGNSLSGLFTQDDEEENPLANLIKTLPDYTTTEIVEDLNEIKRIIQEWRPD
jgi:hypothetical protein